MIDLAQPGDFHKVLAVSAGMLCVDNLHDVSGSICCPCTCYKHTERICIQGLTTIAVHKVRINPGLEENRCSLELNGQLEYHTCKLGASAQIQCQAKTARDTLVVVKRRAGSQVMRCSSLACRLLSGCCTKAAVACRYLHQPNRECVKMF